MPPFALNDPDGFVVLVNRFMDSQMLRVPGYSWSLADARLTDAVLAPDNLFVMNFHPNVIYYDMSSVDDYLKYRPHYHEPIESESFLCKRPSGAAKFIRELLSSVERKYFTTISDFGLARGLWSSPNS